MKKYLIGFIVGAMLTFAVQAGASTLLLGSTIDAVILVEVDGESLGQAPVIDGTSYLPVRSFGNKAGYDVAFGEGKATLTSIEPSPVETPTTEPSATPTPAPSGEPVPTPAPSGGVTPTPDSAVTPEPTLEPTQTPTPTPTPDNTASCQAIRDDYNGQIAALNYQGLTQGQFNLKEYQLGYYRDQALADAGC